MNKNIFSILILLALSGSSKISGIHGQDLITSSKYLAVSASLYAASIWLAKETILDIGYPYVHLKELFNQEKKKLELNAKENNVKLSPKELNFFAFTQALHAAPAEYWREIIAASASIICLYLGTQNLKQGLAHLAPDNFFFTLMRYKK